MLNACVVVLGDIGRSPRMQYHTLSLAKNGYSVDLIAYKGTRPTQEIENNVRITQSLMNDVPEFNKYTGRYLGYLLKVIWQSIALFYTLCMCITSRNTQFIIVQNPPSIPTLFILWIYGCFSRVDIIIDWHNYGFSILALTLGERNYVVRLCRWVEGYFGSKAKYHFCVTESLKKDLKRRWNIDAQVLYDKPPSRFKQLDWTEKHNLLQKLKLVYKEFKDVKNKDCTRITDLDLIENKVKEKSARPAFIISSTSWTEDEDFSILLTALDNYEQMCSKNTVLPGIVCIITGKGPLKEHYANEIKNKIWRSVEIVLPWLESEDYPKLLGTCDLGISLHKSSSNLDLPMKIVDMFGCCLPVCALNYDCIDELVKHDQNGFVFNDGNELTRQLCYLLKNFPKDKSKLSQFSEHIQNNFLKLRWNENWENVFLPLIRPE